MTYDPYAYGYDPYQEYPYDDQPEEEEDPEEKLNKQLALKEAIESNRLYLKKVRRQCVQEDFADLEKYQMFLIEFLVESLSVDTKSELGLISEENEDAESEIVVRVQFLDTPPIEIRQKGEKVERTDSQRGETEFMETVGMAGLKETVDSQPPGRKSETGSLVGSLRVRGSNDGSNSRGSGSSGSAFDTVWEDATGKSLLFSKYTLDLIQGIDKTPVKIQVSKCIEPVEDEEKGTCEPLGYTVVRLPDHFSLSVLQSCKPGVILPVSCSHRASLKLHNVFGTKKGHLDIFVRLSCFGSVITTSFQSVGPDRQYVFNPSPMPNVDGEKERDVDRNDLLKPVLAQEEDAKGIKTVQGEDDVFRKSVVWKDNTKHCGCMHDPSDVIMCGPGGGMSLAMPRPSDDVLCRDQLNGAKPTQERLYCDWHHLVRKEIHNNPGGNCGCMDDVTVIKSPRGSKYFEGKSQAPNTTTLVSADNVKTQSRVQKMSTKVETLKPKFPEKVVKPIIGLGIKPEPTHCGCNCPPIRNSLKDSPMMKYTWQVQ